MTADFEVRHQDANHALFMVLIECANLVIECGAERDKQPTAVTVARNISGSGKPKMANREIADLAFRLAAELRPWNDDARITQLKRILSHVVLADRWEAQLRG